MIELWVEKVETWKVRDYVFRDDAQRRQVRFWH
jgi:hypothetical protein